MITSLEGKTKKVDISPDQPTVIIGERINPTGRPRLAEAIKNENWDMLKQEAVAQVKQGADIIDVNINVPGLNEVELLPLAVKVISEVVDVPLALDTSNHQSLEAALKVCPGRPLINSTTGEEKDLSVVFPLARKFNAGVIVLCHDEKGISSDPKVRFNVAERIVSKATQFGLQGSDLLLDPLVLTMATDAKSAIHSLETVLNIKEKLGLNMTMGLSNVSFGLPDRYLINNSFMAMAIWCGINAPIVNPAAKGMVETIVSADLLKGKDAYATRYIKHYRERQKKQTQ